MKKSLKERFLEKIKKNKSGCWVWQSTIGSRGYGQIYVDSIRKARLAHRISYELFKGEIPKGLHVHHKCENIKCVNPKHLKAVTCRTNVLLGKGAAAQNARKNKCVRGHSFKKYGYTDHKNRRICSECKRIAARVYRKKYPNRDRKYDPEKRREYYLRCKDHANR